MYRILEAVLLVIEAIIFANGIDKYIELRKENRKSAMAMLVPVPIAFAAILHIML